jgi:transcriptional regulator with XRE-family HTH domain
MLPNRMLSHARALRGWSQGIVAERLGTTRKMVSRWECGETFPSPYYRELLCQLFGLDAKALGLLPLTADNYHTDVDERDAITEPLFAIVSPGQFNTAQHFIGHEDLLHNLLYHLHPGSSLALTGLPGVGKTAVVSKLLHFPQVQERFPNGVIWVKLGPNPDLYHCLAWIAASQGFSMPEVEKVKEETERLQILSNCLYEAFISRRLLIVLDDVWTVEAVLPFLIESPSVAYIFTTRLPKVAFALTSQQPYVVSPLSSETSLQLLTAFVPGIEAIDGTLQQGIVECTGGLPLAITLIGKYLGLQSYGGQLRRLEAALNQLVDPEYRLQLSSPSLAMNAPFLQRDNHGYSLETEIARSTHHLSEAVQTAFWALSILPCTPAFFTEEAALAVAAIQDEVLNSLVDEGLLEPIEKNCYRIHRVIADYAHSRLKGNAAQIRLVHYMEKVCSDHRTNIALLKREYSTLLAGLCTARMLRMHKEMIQGVLILVPLMHMRGETAQADFFLRKALHSAIDLQDKSLCREILARLAFFAQLRRDEAQFSVYQSFMQSLGGQQAQNHALSHLVKIQKTVREQADTPRMYVF